jgi:hypothetical protein
VVHAPAHLLIPIPTVKHQSISVVRAIIEGKIASVGSRSFRFERALFNSVQGAPRPPGIYAERPWDKLPECSGSIHHLRD